MWREHPLRRAIRAGAWRGAGLADRGGGPVHQRPLGERKPASRRLGQGGEERHPPLRRDRRRPEGRGALSSPEGVKHLRRELRAPARSVPTTEGETDLVLGLERLSLEGGRGEPGALELLAKPSSGRRVRPSAVIGLPRRGDPADALPFGSGEVGGRRWANVIQEARALK